MNGLSSVCPVCSTKKYKRLRGDEIRLLRVRDCTSTTIFAELTHVFLSECNVEYFALSYCWQSDGPEQDILVDGRLAKISSSLWNALREISKHAEYVWCDQLCIDQEDDEEKALQILRMSTIYRTATQTAIWLGDEADGSSQVMDLITESHEDPGSNQFRDLPSLEQLQAFFSRPYWRRVWVIQEIATSNKPVIYCGNCVVDWNSLVSFLENLSASQLDGHMDGLESATNIAVIRSRLRFDRLPTGLLQLLCQTERSLATFQRDKTYGLLGLAFDSSSFVSTPYYGKNPNGQFKRSDDDVLMTRSYITNTSSLDIILFGRHLYNRKPASWCPSFLNSSKGGFDPRMADYISGVSTQLFAGRRKRYLSTTGQSRHYPTSHMNHGPKMLGVSGVCVAIVDSLGKICSDGDESSYPTKQSSYTSQGFMVFYGALFRLLALYSEEYENVHKFQRDLGFTLNTLDAEDTDGPDWTWRRMFRENLDMAILGGPLRVYFEILEAFHAPMKDSTYGSGSLSLSDAGRREMREKLPAELERSMNDMVRQQLRLTTLRVLPRAESELESEIDSTAGFIIEQEGGSEAESGSYPKRETEAWLGWAHQDARVGDEVWLLEGCTIPVILRPAPSDAERTSDVSHFSWADQAYAVVGHAYVDVMGNVMDGREWERRSGQLKTIVLY